MTPKVTSCFPRGKKGGERRGKGDDSADVETARGVKSECGKEDNVGRGPIQKYARVGQCDSAC